MRWTQDVNTLKALQQQQILITRQNGLGLAIKCRIKKLIVLGVATNLKLPCDVDKAGHTATPEGGNSLLISRLVSINMDGLF